MRVITEVIVAAGLSLLLSACSQQTVEISFQERLDLGQKCLTEMDYEQAVIELTKAISVDAKSIEAYKMLSEAYSGLGLYEKAAEASLETILMQTPQAGTEAWDADVSGFIEQLEKVEDPGQADLLAEMAYAQTNDSRFLMYLFTSKGKQRDFDGISRLINEAEMIIDGMHDEYLETLLQSFYDDKDYDAMKTLVDVVGETKVSPGIPLILNLLTSYNENGQDGIVDFLEGFFDRGEELPDIEASSEVYVGDKDEMGRRNGFGICYYGPDVKPDSRIYAGYWKDDLRSGDGRAYKRANYRIQCNWEEDYPEGEVTILQENITVLGTLRKGHVATSMNLYENGTWTAVHCTADSTKDTGYSFQTVKMEKPGTCHHVEKHSYCWDCMQGEQEKEAE